MHQVQMKKVLSSMPRWVQQAVFLFYTRGWNDFMDDLSSDRLVSSGRIHCDDNLFFIAGLPKSGTTWLEQLLSNTPGMVQLNKSSLRPFPRYVKMNDVHDVIPEMLTCAPKNRLSFLKLHLNPNQDNFNTLDGLNIKTVVQIRDLRDMLISRYFHILAKPTHWDHKRLKGLTQNEQLLESMITPIPDGTQTVIEYYGNWISGWLERAKKSSQNTRIISFEQLKNDVHTVLENIYSFYGYQIIPSEIQRVVEKQKNRYAIHLKEGLGRNLKKKGRSVSTFRKGTIGEWRKYFDDRTKRLFKESGGQILIDSGYESDFNW